MVSGYLVLTVPKIPHRTHTKKELILIDIILPHVLLSWQMIHRMNWSVCALPGGPKVQDLRELTTCHCRLTTPPVAFLLN